MFVVRCQEIEYKHVNILHLDQISCISTETKVPTLYYIAAR